MIKYKWCAYGLCSKRLGKIEEQNQRSVRIRYSEGQMYPTELWDDNKHYVVKFKTIKEAMDYIIQEGRSERSVERILDSMCWDFKAARRYKKHFINEDGCKLVKNEE